VAAIYDGKGERIVPVDKILLPPSRRLRTCISEAVSGGIATVIDLRFVGA